MKKCSKCGKEKPAGDFSRRKNAPDGRRGVCKACKKEQCAEYLQSDQRKEAVRAYAQTERGRAAHKRAHTKYNRSEKRKATAKRFNQTEKGKELSRRGSVRYANKYPQKIRAHNAVNHAIEHGRMVRGACEVCDAQNAEGHHPDYAKLLDVDWLCPKHHNAEHRRNNVE